MDEERRARARDLLRRFPPPPPSAEMVRKVSAVLWAHAEDVARAAEDDGER